MRKIFSLFILLTVAFPVFAQLKVELSYGFATYSMKDIKLLNKDILKSLPVDARVTDNFPGQPYYDAGVYYPLSHITMFGINCSYHTTGSRISYIDYSGELRIDNVISAYSPGLVLGFMILEKKIKVEEENTISISFTKLKMEEDILGQKVNYTLKSYSPQFEPRIKASANIGSFSFGIKGGYLIDFKGKTRFDKYIGEIVKKRDDEEVKTNWASC